MFRRKSNLIAVLAVISYTLLESSAQNLSPFGPPVPEEFQSAKSHSPPSNQVVPNVRNKPQPTRQNQEQGVVFYYYYDDAGPADNSGVGPVVKSPFGPPNNPNRPKKPTSPLNAKPNPTTTTTTTQEPAKTVAPFFSQKNIYGEEANESPFKPPDQQEWRQGSSPPGQGRKSGGKQESWLSPSHVRQFHNEEIPSLSDIQIVSRSNNNNNNNPNNNNNNNNNKGNRRRIRGKGKPKISVYQDADTHRDMHDTGPGVTPWTRYTEKPRVQDSDTWESAPKATARCGSRRYSPRSQICCQGHVERRTGIKPACCGSEAYDTVFNKCCNGAVSFRSHDQPDC